MPDDSVVQSWLEDPDIQREIEYVQRHFKLRADDRIHAGWFVLGVHILEALSMYGGDEEPAEENTEAFPDPDDDDEPWKKGGTW